MNSLLLILVIASCQMLMDGVLPSTAQTPILAKPSEMQPGDSRSTHPTTQSIARTDRVLIETKTATFTRGKKGEEYPNNEKTAIVHYPQVTGLADQAVLRKVQSAVSLKSVFGQSLAEFRAEFQESWWLSEINYTVNYNQNSLLDLTFTISGVGAYPSVYDKHRLVSLKTGKVVKAADVFKRESLGTIAAMVNKAMQAEVQAAIANGGTESVALRDRLSNKRFQIKNLDTFVVSDQGITFLYDFEFPHVILALEPPGKYFLSYNQLKGYMKPDGALGVFLPNAAAKNR